MVGRDAPASVPVEQFPEQFIVLRILGILEHNDAIADLSAEASLAFLHELVQLPLVEFYSVVMKRRPRIPVRHTVCGRAST